jgi:hypothetical protein
MGLERYACLSMEPQRSVRNTGLPLVLI